MMAVSEYSGMMDMTDLLCWGVGLGFFESDDECADESEECEYDWHGESPLLRVVVLPGSFPDIQLYAKPVPKGKYNEVNVSGCL